MRSADLGAAQASQTFRSDMVDIRVYFLEGGGGIRRRILYRVATVQAKSAVGSTINTPATMRAIHVVSKRIGV